MSCCHIDHIRFGPQIDYEADKQERERVIDRIIGAIKEKANMSAVLRLKMSVNSVKRVADANGAISQEEIGFNAVYGPEGTANAQWSKWTPMAQLSMTINNPDAFGKVLPGQFVFVDLTLCDKDNI